jgi:hypothetical protein
MAFAGAEKPIPLPKDFLGYWRPMSMNGGEDVVYVIKSDGTFNEISHKDNSYIISKGEYKVVAADEKNAYIMYKERATERFIKEYNLHLRKDVFYSYIVLTLNHSGPPPTGSVLMSISENDLPYFTKKEWELPITYHQQFLPEMCVDCSNFSTYYKKIQP